MRYEKFENAAVIAIAIAFAIVQVHLVLAAARGAVGAVESRGAETAVTQGVPVAQLKLSSDQG
jgi:hypothetical protein